MISQSKDYFIRTDCRLCGGALGKPVVDLGSTALANEYPPAPIEGGQDKFPLYLCVCETCGHVQLPVVVSPERLFPPDYPYVSGTNPVFRAHLKEFAATVRGMLRDTNGCAPNVFEIASNDGTLLREFIQLRTWAHGIDPAATGAGGTRAFFTERWAKEQRALQGTKWHYDAIVALNVFAHVDDLNDFTAGVAALMPEDGLFVFEVGYLPDVVSKGLFDVIYHEHLSYHSLRPLREFFGKHGLIIVNAHRVDSQGGSIRVFVRKIKFDPGGLPFFYPRRLLDLFAAEEGLTVELLVQKIQLFRYQLDKLLSSAAWSHKTVAGFGAPAKLTTLLSGLNTMRPSVIYDDNPAKVGKVTPGNFIPIAPSARLLEDQPDYCIIFSWNFADEIMARFPDYKGKWVIPLPTFQVIG